MDFLNAVLLGIVQGVAEFLPISSSGHLSLMQSLLGIGGLAELDNNAVYNVMLHVGTLVAVFVAYWSDIRDMIVELFNMLTGKAKAGKAEKNMPMRRQILMMILATLPLFLVLPFEDKIQSIGAYPLLVGCALLINGTLLFMADRTPVSNKDEKSITAADALIVGFFQAIATIPGISRSGITITAGLGRNFERSYAVKFSFLLSLVAVAGAVFLKVLDLFKMEIDVAALPAYITGMIISGVVGYASIKFLQKIVDKGKFGGFAYYCWAVGGIAVLATILRG